MSVHDDSKFPDNDLVQRMVDATGASASEALRLERERRAVSKAKDILSALVDAAIASAPGLLAGASGGELDALALARSAVDIGLQRGGGLRADR